MPFPSKMHFAAASLALLSCSTIATAETPPPGQTETPQTETPALVSFWIFGKEIVLLRAVHATSSCDDPLGAETTPQNAPSDLGHIKPKERPFAAKESLLTIEERGGGTAQVFGRIDKPTTLRVDGSSTVILRRK